MELSRGHLVSCILVSVLLVGALVSTVVCLGAFTAKNNEVVAFTHAYYPDKGPVCQLFVQFSSSLLDFFPPSYTICQFVIWSSTVVIVLVAVLGVLSIIVFVTDHFVIKLLRCFVTFFSFLLMLTISIVIAAGVATTCISFTNASSGSSCSEIDTILRSSTSYFGSMIAAAVSGWISAGLHLFTLVLVCASLRSQSRVEQPTYRELEDTHDSYSDNRPEMFIM